MPRLVFTQNLKRHVDCPELTVPGATVREALDAAFADRPQLRGYILDDQGGLHRHMAIIVNGDAIADRRRLDQPVAPADEIYVMQALSGG